MRETLDFAIFVGEREKQMSHPDGYRLE